MTDRPSWELEPGDEIVPGRRAVKRLGGGRKAEVYLATDDRLRTTVVAKLLRPGLSDDRSIAGLRHEADLLDQLRHPSFPRLFDVRLEAGERRHIAIEHVEGPRLSTLLRRFGPLSLEQLLPLTLELSSAIHYLHDVDHVHLDVKPGNVVMGSVARLIDLGLARTVERARALRGRVGTASFMAPEQHDAVAAGGVGPPADIWGIGATLFAAVTAEPPLQARRREVGEGYAPTPHDVAGLRLPATVPAAFQEAVLSCLAWDPGDRPTAGELGDAIEPLVAQLPSRPVLGDSRPRLTRRRRG